MANARLDWSWDSYRYFLAVARTGTLSAAARQLGTEHTTVARHVKILEAELATPLFHRSNQGYELTEAGQRLLATAAAIESAVVAAKTTAMGEQRVAGSVRVGAPDGFGTVFLAPRLGELAQRHPELEVEVIAIPRLLSLAKREADIVIGLSAAAQSRVMSRRLTDYRLYLYGSEAYLAAAGAPRTVGDLKSHRIIGYVEELVFVPEVDYLDVIGPQAQARICSTSIVTQAHAVLGGAGLGILPAFIGSAYPALVPVLADQIAVERAFHMHIHEDNRRSTPVRAVAEFIAQASSSSSSSE
jgi:DNA-binding transcriptional LysR family regulator